MVGTRRTLSTVRSPDPRYSRSSLVKLSYKKRTVGIGQRSSVRLGRRVDVLALHLGLGEALCPLGPTRPWSGPSSQVRRVEVRLVPRRRVYEGVRTDGDGPAGGVGMGVGSSRRWRKLDR